MGRVFEGETSKELAPILSAGHFREVGTRLVGKILTKFQTRNGACYSVELGEETEFSGSDFSPAQEGTLKLKVVSIGEYKGMMQVLNAVGCELQRGDAITLESTGTVDTGKENDMIAFKVKITRP